MRRTLINLLLALAAVMVCLILTEVGLRIYNLARPRSHIECYESSPIPDLPHITRANFTRGDFHTNSGRLRDSEIPLDKPAETLRLAMVGNSMTIGHSVKQGELYTEVMERDLKARFQGHPKADVLNAGQLGYSIVHFLPFTREFVYPYHPDFVVYQFCWNDIEASSLMRVRKVPYQLPKSGPVRLLARHSHLFGNMMRLRDMSKFARNLLVMYDDSLAVEGFYKDLFAWEDSVRSRGLPFAMVIFPNVLEVQVPDRYPDLVQELLAKKEKILERCRQRGLPVLDLTDSLADNYRRHHKDLYLDFGHFNARGHALAAEVIENWLIRRPEFQDLVQNSISRNESIE